MIRKMKGFLAIGMVVVLSLSTPVSVYASSDAAELMEEVLEVSEEDTDIACEDDSDEGLAGFFPEDELDVSQEDFPEDSQEELPDEEDISLIEEEFEEALQDDAEDGLQEFAEETSEEAASEASSEDEIVIFEEKDEKPGNLGYVYVDETEYHITFTAKNNGETKNLTYKLNIPEGSTSTLEDAIGAKSLNEVKSTMKAFFPENSDAIIYGWIITADAVNISNVTSWSDYSPELEGEYQLEYGRDYLFTAQLYKQAAENIYIVDMPGVTYDGRAHVLDGEDIKYNNKSKARDLSLSVIYSKDPVNGGKALLRFGKDYTAKYYNNKDVSVKVSDTGEYVPLYSDNDPKRPRVEITGKGNYAGFSATAYFDIFPYNIGTGYYGAAQVSGLKNLYALGASGKIKAKINPKVTWRNTRIAKTFKLKKGVDYEPRIYKYDEDSKWVLQPVSDPCDITSEGRYLYTVRGCGNYCGTAFGQDYEEQFDDGTFSEMNPAVCSYSGSDYVNCQFLVMSDLSKDLSNAKITIKKKSVPFKHGKWYTPSDLGLKVIIGKGKDARQLTEGKDYTVTFDGVDFSYISGRTYEDGKTLYYRSTSYAIFEGKINIANKYKVIITAVPDSDYFGTKKLGKTVTIKGVTINKKDYKGAAKSYTYNGKNLSSGDFIRTKLWGATTRVVNPSTVGYDSNGNSYFLEREATYTPDNGVYILYDHHNKLPGTYKCTIYPLGPGVYRGSKLAVTFKRKGISTKTAVKKGFLKATMDSADYNAGGSMPKNIKITYNGRVNEVGELKYNGQKFYVSDVDGDYLGVTLYANKNKKAGAGAGLIIKGDGKVFKGKSGKFGYSVDYVNVDDDTVIPVIKKDNYFTYYGEITDEIKSFEVGRLYAVINPVKKAGGTPKADITLYQTYFKDDTDYSRGVVRLAKLSSSQYKLGFTAVDSSDNCYVVTVSNKKTPLIDGIKYGENVTLSEHYTVYDDAAKIVGAKVVYKGKTYEFPSTGETAFEFTGSQIRFDLEAGDGVKEITLSDGTVLSSDNFYVEYGENISVGKDKKGGSFTIILKRNAKTGTFNSGGSATFYFSISEAPKVVA